MTVRTRNSEQGDGRCCQEPFVGKRLKLAPGTVQWTPSLFLCFNKHVSTRIFGHDSGCAQVHFPLPLRAGLSPSFLPPTEESLSRSVLGWLRRRREGPFESTLREVVNSPASVCAHYSLCRFSLKSFYLLGSFFTLWLSLLQFSFGPQCFISLFLSSFFFSFFFFKQKIHI